MFRKTMLLTVFVSLLTGFAARAEQALMLSESNVQQLMPVLGPLSIGELALKLSKGEEPVKAAADVTAKLKADLQKESAGSAKETKTINDTVAKVQMVLGMAKDKLSGLLKKGFGPESAAESVLADPKVSDQIVNDSVEEIAKQAVEN